MGYIADTPHHCGSYERRPNGRCAHCHREAARRRREREKAATGKHSPKEWEEKAATYLACPLCNRPWSDCRPFPGSSKAFTKGHILALEDGGSNAIENLQPECMECNLGKPKKSPLSA